MRIGTEIIKAMDKPRSEYVNLPSLTDDDLYDLFAWADGHNDGEMALACSREITRRCNRPVVPVHDVPKWLLWLPRVFWHTKPGGGGEGA